jgi:hypothetical protein
MADRFDCAHCKESLYGRKYIQSEERPHCIPCYDSLFSNTCDECKELIAHDARVRGSLMSLVRFSPLTTLFSLGSVTCPSGEVDTRDVKGGISCCFDFSICFRLLYDVYVYIHVI